MQFDMATAAARNFLRLIQEFFDWFNTSDEPGDTGNIGGSGGSNPTLIGGAGAGVTSTGSEVSSSSSVTENN